MAAAKILLDSLEDKVKDLSQAVEALSEAADKISPEGSEAASRTKAETPVASEPAPPEPKTSAPTQSPTGK